MSVAKVFETQARACDMLGSPFTAQMLRSIPDCLSAEHPLGRKTLNWPGNMGPGGASVPLRLAGGFHALVRLGRVPDLARLYPPNATPDARKLTVALSDVMTRESDFLLEWLESPPQTNEVSRSAPLIAAGLFLSTHFRLPLRLLELGASAGLNLQWDRYALVVNGHRHGPEGAGVTLAPDWSGDDPGGSAIEVSSRAGVDLNPLFAENDFDRLRLMSFLWPDQPDRLERARQALSVARAYPVALDRLNAADWLETMLADPAGGSVTVVFHTIAWQYFDQDTQHRCKAVIERHANEATAANPLAWLSVEADGDPNSAKIVMRLWPENKIYNLGRADFHGRWIDWRAPGTAEKET